VKNGKLSNLINKMYQYKVIPQSVGDSLTQTVAKTSGDLIMIVILISISLILLRVVLSQFINLLKKPKNNTFKK
jgi:hypothetical protein